MEQVEIKSDLWEVSNIEDWLYSEMHPLPQDATIRQSSIAETPEPPSDKPGIFGGGILILKPLTFSSVGTEGI
jgi:hypothetical protein